MATCFYHPEAKAKFVCPDCGQDVCDNCRIEGGLQRCGHCATHGPPARPEEAGAEGFAADYSGGSFAAGDELDAAFSFAEGGVAVASEPPGASHGFDGALVDDLSFGATDFAGEPSSSGFDDFMAGVTEAMPSSFGAGVAAQPVTEDLVMCSYHGDVVAEIQCLNCYQPYCLACLPSGTQCAPCKADPSGRALQAESFGPSSVTEVGYEPGMDFAASYADRGGIHEGLEVAAQAAEVAAARPRKPKKSAKKGQAVAPKKAAKKFKGPRLSPKLLVGGLAALALVGGVAWWVTVGQQRFFPPPPPFKGPTKVAIVSPKAATIRGVQQIQLQVASPQQVELVLVTIDKKHWAKFKKPPFKSEWPTNVHKPGKHEVEAKATYKHGVTVTHKKTYVVKSK
ncbi:MAG: B-box zinc finger protein [Candidatus Sericytochromatia bacterium]|nr:B-box zinc finger protein [Candidatus Sericytochromatia bacterium]